MNLQQAYQVLDISDNASPEEIRQAYIDLASIWHPDRHIKSTRLHKKAMDKMKELNAAYDCIRSYLSVDNSKSEADDHHKEMLITCPNCGIKNRVSLYNKWVIVNCGKCDFTILDARDMKESDDWGQKTICSDRDCRGIIGPDGRCLKCGKFHKKTPKAGKYKSRLKKEARRERVPTSQKTKRIKKAFYFLACFVVLIFSILMITDTINISIKSKKQIVLYFPRKTTDIPPPIKKSTRRSKVLPVRAAKKPSPKTKSRIKLLTKEFFKKSSLDKKSVVPLQRNLLVLGYKIGRADGIMGSKTIAGINNFITDFKVKPIGNFNDLFKSTVYHAKIAGVHPDWLMINKSDKLNGWISERPPMFLIDIQRALQSKDHRKAIKVINYYKFEKGRPLPLPLPKNGIIKKFFKKGLAPLRINTKNTKRRYYIKLVNISSNKVVLTAFVREGSTLKIKVPLEKCELRYAAGRIWFGENFLFGTNSIFGKIDNVFDFKKVGYKVSGYDVNMLQAKGNRKTKNISAFDF